ncbi:MAG: methionine--tRNA ligase subunit beta [Candidatus Omnitrophica bacterium]|nr:methionine--tRNA ligase subunit beta [Candidatus Omnitrophota bacterium]MCM8783783.1 methionine--tRNA ligase subunit beta [Candidatus Omnitrophota bacterium]
MISLEEFKKIELKVAKIIEVKEHPQADKLYVLKVNTGNEIKQLVAGIRKFYTPQQLLNKNIVIINNLQPAMIRGIESQGMLLAASDTNNNISLILPDKDIAPGSTIR